MAAAVTQRPRIMDKRCLSKFSLYPLLFTLMIGCAVADPYLSPQESGTHPVPLAPSTDPTVTASTVATVTAIQDDTGPTIPLDFVGFSDEAQDVITDTIFTPSNTSLIGLLRLLGPNGVMRIGGDASDTNPAPALTQQIANDLQAFVSQVGSGWKIIYGLDAFVQNPDLAVTQAGYLLNAFGANNIAFQVGNEPEFYLSETQWVNTFNSYYSDLTSNYRGLGFGGADDGVDQLPWLDATVLGSSGFQYRTIHKYLGCTPQNVTPAQVLADAAVSSNPGVTLSEFGIICGGGQQGITDRLMAATYYLKLAQSAFASGFSHILPHNVLTPFNWGDGNPPRRSYYNQFFQQWNGLWAPKPMFYGVYLFSKLRGQVSISTSAVGLDSLASVLATLGPNGNANILVVNGDTEQGFWVKPQQTRPWSTANFYRLAGKNCTDPSPVLNGHLIGGSGIWTGGAKILHNGQNVPISPCGAVLIEIQS